MKKTLLALIVVAAITSCTKETTKSIESNCDCGEVTSVNHIVITDTTTIDLYLEYYDYQVKNNCTGANTEHTTQFNGVGEYAIPVLGEEICN